MKDLLIQTAKQTGIIDVQQLTGFLDSNKSSERIDEVLLQCPYFTEESVLRLFAAALSQQYFDDIPAKLIPLEFVQSVPAAYAQKHLLIGIKKSNDNGSSENELTVILSRPLDTNALDNISKMTKMPVKPALATRTTITSAIDVAYEQRSTVIEEVAEESIPRISTSSPMKCPPPMTCSM